MTTTGSNGGMHPGLTITIYRVNPQTLARTRPRTRVIEPADGPAESLVFPPCECPRCSDRPDR
ncbi:hypothetical protein ACF1AY_04980 [Streptomyces sp. NPDC014776]|uniref:hypothetical protein n=1 Tax=Streptomyces sp. NPDC014776 TaxID=3364909 RepID=UPI0037009613